MMESSSYLLNVQNLQSNKNERDDATQKQRLASDPMVSSWVGASAGSGKTKVLTDRILKLLLPRENGEPASPPEKILALTFTKAAANEMALRLSSRLSKWAILDDEELRRDMDENLFGRDPTPQEMIAARQLFARVVDAPGGLNIMTIHSFCQSVLGRFPIEAGIPPNFKPLEEDASRALLQQAIKNILSYADANKDHPLFGCVKRISTQAAEDQFNSLISDIVKERYQFEQILKTSFGVDGLYAQLCHWFDIHPNVPQEQALEEFCTSEEINENGLRAACKILSAGKTKNSPIMAQDIQLFLDADKKTRIEMYAHYKNIYLTQKGGIRATLGDKGSLEKNPEIGDILNLEAERVYVFEDYLKKIALTQSTHDLFTIGQAVIENYQYLKNAQGGLDFDDMILKTLSLFKGEYSKGNNNEVTPWIMYKMDGGLDHILVDEAQDTNPEQWNIIQLLASEFFTGNDGHDITRTLFVVGDEKQSIFGFQRAAPEKFGDMKKWFEKKITESGKKFVPVAIDTSFRSSQTILDAVDSVFTQGTMGANFESSYRPHHAKRQGQSGIVEIWPVLKNKTSEDIDKNQGADHSGLKKQIAWDIPDTPVESRSGSLQMAQKIGNTIEKWIKDKEKLESYDRAIEAGDILVLVRSRNAFVAQLVRILKSKNIPVSGVDRMVLNDQLVVQDICAAAQFGLLPDDDLNLACLLKSPFIGISEDDLYDLCRLKKSSLWTTLKNETQNQEYKKIVLWLNSLVDMASSLAPYDFFAQIVQEPCPASQVSGLQAIRVRLGVDSLDPLDEFLNIAMGFDAGHNGALQSFLKWHNSGSSDIKRELQEGGGAVRIMTVHGAKGLQAPIVFMPDTIRTRTSDNTSIFWPHKTKISLPFYCTSISKMPLCAMSHRETLDSASHEEYRRLLYVAMTRAEERLYIGGYYGKKAPAQDNDKLVYWYKDIHTALSSHDRIQKITDPNFFDDDKTLSVLRLYDKRTAAPDKAKPVPKDMGDSNVALPDWVYKNIPDEPFPPKPLVPSKPSQEDDGKNPSPLDHLNHNRFKRGNVTHKLLQILPDIPTENREAALIRFLANPAHDLDEQTQKSIKDEVIAILTHPDFGKIFGPGSMAEVPLTGLLNENSIISGQIDRLLVTDKEVYIIDFKTNRPPPQRKEDIPQAYIRQMTLYAKAIQEIYPSKHIHAALLWTDGAQLMTLDLG